MEGSKLRFFSFFLFNIGSLAVCVPRARSKALCNICDGGWSKNDKVVWDLYFRYDMLATQANQSQDAAPCLESE